MDQQPYEFLMRWADDGSYRGAHYIYREVHVSQAGERILGRAMMADIPAGSSAIAEVAPAINAAMAQAHVDLKAKHEKLAKGHEMLRRDYDRAEARKAELETALAKMGERLQAAEADVEVAKRGPSG